MKLPLLRKSLPILEYQLTLISLNPGPSKFWQIQKERQILVPIYYENVPCSICHSKGHLDGICSRSAKTREDIPIEVQNREGILGKVPSSSNVFGSSIVSIPGFTKVPENAKSAQATHGSSQHVVSQQQSPATSQYLASQPLHLGGSTTSTQSQSVSSASTLNSKPQLPVQPQKPVADFFATRLASLPRDVKYFEQNPGASIKPL